MSDEEEGPAMAAANLRALGEGANARRDGKARDDNPYPWWRSEHNEWNEGWAFIDSQTQATTRGRRLSP